MFLGDIQVVYHFDTKENILPDKVKVERMVLGYSNGIERAIKEDRLKDDLARDVRDHKVSRIDIYIITK